MKSPKNKTCKKCDTITRHRHVKNKTNGYYVCSICSENTSKKYRKNNWFKYLAGKVNGRKKPKSETITEGMLKRIYINQDKVCTLSGMPFNMDESLYRPSLDRRDNSKGYTEDNIQLVLFIVNKMKRELVEQEFITICYNIGDNYKSKKEKEI